jgi:hypothetical protein
MWGRDKKKGNKYIKQKVASVGNLIVIRIPLLYVLIAEVN